MGLQLIIKEVVLNDVSKKDLEWKVEEFDEDIARCREKLMMLAASTPRQVPDAEGNPMDWVEHCQFEVSQTLDELRDAFINRHLAGIAMASPDDVEESY